jgi:hypothetical protein
MSTVAPTIVRHSTCKSSYHDELRSVIVALQRTLPDAPASPQTGGTGPEVEVELPAVIQRYLSRRVASAHPRSARHTPATRPRRARTDVGSKDMLTDDVWIPKHPEIVRIGFDTLRDKYEDIVIRTLNRDYGPDDFSSKLMVGRLSGRIVHYQKNDCSQNIKVSIALANLCARLVTVANEIAEDDETGEYEGARIVQQTGVQSPGWRSRETKGAGLACNTKGEEVLLPVAIAELERRFKAGQVQAGKRPSHLDEGAVEEAAEEKEAAMDDSEGSEGSEAASSSEGAEAGAVMDDSEESEVQVAGGASEGVEAAAVSGQGIPVDFDE